MLFEKADPLSYRGILHIIGERPGTMHHSYSVYITVAKGKVWADKKIDHDITKVVWQHRRYGLAAQRSSPGNHDDHEGISRKGCGWESTSRGVVKKCGAGSTSFGCRLQTVGYGRFWQAIA